MSCRWGWWKKDCVGDVDGVGEIDDGDDDGDDDGGGDDDNDDNDDDVGKMVQKMWVMWVM